MSAFNNPFAKKPVNPFADPTVAQQAGGSVQPVQDFGYDGGQVPSAAGSGGGAWGQPSMGSGAWGQGQATSNGNAQQADTYSTKEVPKQSQGDRGQGSKQQAQPKTQDRGLGWGQQNPPQADAPQQPAWGQNFGYSSSAQAKGEDDGTNNQSSANIRKRETDLAKREKELKALEQQVQKNGGVVNKKNFPPLISCCYHSIKQEIPEDSKRLMRMIMGQFWAVNGVLLYNFIAVCVGFGGYSSGEHVLPFILALVYLVVGAPLTWFLWYRRIYNGMKAKGVFGYVMYLTFNCATIVFGVWNAIAPPIPTGLIPHSEQASAGFIPAIQLFQKKGSGQIVTGIFFIVGFGLWVLLVLYSIYLEIMVGRKFRGSGGAAKVQSGARYAQQVGSRLDKV